jgi:hypothetical protein
MNMEGLSHSRLINVIKKEEEEEKHLGAAISATCMQKKVDMDLMVHLNYTLAQELSISNPMRKGLVLIIVLATFPP